jgi:hypothetical protein
MAKRSVYINADGFSQTTTTSETVSKKPRTGSASYLNIGDLVTFNGSDDEPWQLGVACNRSKVSLV